jgi:hypothetical protein
MSKQIIKPNLSITGVDISQINAIKKNIWPVISTNLASSQEQKEKERINTVHIVYRDNNLYSTLVPQIIQELELVGKNVVRHCFPVGTSKEVITQYFNQDITDSLRGAELLIDRTCYDALPDGGYQFCSSNEIKQTLPKLDGVSQMIMYNSLGGSTISQEKKNYLTVQYELDILQKVMKDILTNNNQIKKLYIVRDLISDHGFENKLLRLTKSRILKEEFYKIYSKEYNDIKDSQWSRQAEEMKKLKETEILSTLTPEQLTSIIQNNSIFRLNSK